QPGAGPRPGAVDGADLRGGLVCGRGLELERGRGWLVGDDPQWLTRRLVDALGLRRRWLGEAGLARVGAVERHEAEGERQRDRDRRRRFAKEFNHAQVVARTRARFSDVGVRGRDRERVSDLNVSTLRPAFFAARLD